MVARIISMLGLFAFAVTVIGGVIVQNSFSYTLSRALLAMLLFSGVGLVVGCCAERVVREYQKRQHEEIFGPEQTTDSATSSENPPEDNSTIETAQPIQG